ncbi:MAG: ATP-binding protein [Crocinitomicaceae bacterium]|nr:ATP-binding protein [Crocinitomicaceae bacterium]
MKNLAKIEKQNLLIIDNFGIQPRRRKPRVPDGNYRDRHGKAPTILTSQVPVSKWHETSANKPCRCDS